MLSGWTLHAIMGMSVLDRVSLTAIVKTLPPRFNSPNTGVLPAAPTPAFAHAAKTDLIHFDFARQFTGFLGQAITNDLAQPMVKTGR
jgi:hypothetical protein